MLDAKKVAKQWPEFWNKKKISISDNWVQKAVVMHNHIHYNFWKLKYINDNLNQFVMDHLCEPINDN